MDVEQVIQEPTRVTDVSKTFIDHIYISHNVNTLHYSGCIERTLSDHFATFIIFSNHDIKTLNNKSFRRIFSETNKIYFCEKSNKRNEQFKQNFSPSYSKDENNLKWEGFIANIQTDLEECFPLRKIPKSKARCKPWITKDLIKECKEKHRLYKDFKNRPSNHLKKTKYLTYKRKLEKNIYEAKSVYFSKYLINDKNNKRFWDLIKNSKCERKSNKSINIWDHNLNKLLTEPSIICSKFNDFFSSICHNHVTHSYGNYAHYLKKNINSVFKIKTANEESIFNIIKNLKNTSACGPYV